jgi:hypothetical protein
MLRLSHQHEPKPGGQTDQYSLTAAPPYPAGKEICLLQPVVLDLARAKRSFVSKGLRVRVRAPKQLTRQHVGYQYTHQAALAFLDGTSIWIPRSLLLRRSSAVVSFEGFKASVSETYAEPGRARTAISNSLRVLAKSVKRDGGNGRGPTA